MYIAFESPEGGGKTTQIRLLESALQKRGYRALCVREPGDTAAGTRIREVLLHAPNIELDGITEAFLFSADRAQHVIENVRPALAAGTIVLSDRSFWSTIVYQGHGRRQNIPLLWKLIKLAIGKTRPELVFLLDLPVSIGLARKKGQGEWNRLDAESIAFHERIRKGYLKEAHRYGKTWFIIDATKSIEEIHETILNEAVRRFNLRTR